MNVGPATWTSLLGPITLAAGEFLLYLDPDALDAPASVAGSSVLVTDAWALRRVVEQRLRSFAAQEVPVFVHVTIPTIRQPSDLPFDLRDFPRRILDVRLPGAALPEVRDLPPTAVEQLVGSASLPSRLAALARALSGLSWPPVPDTAVLSVVRLVPNLGPELRRMLLETCPAGPAHRILGHDEPLAILADLLGEWAAAGSDHPDDPAFRAAAEELSLLLNNRQISAPATDRLATSLPRVVREAVHETNALPSLLMRLETLPEPGPSLGSWLHLAEVWAAVRWQLAALPPNPDVAAAADKVWHQWSQIDPQWQTWLRANYAVELSRNVLRPASVHKVAPFLAATAVDAGAKVLLLVLDGLGVAQWQQICRHLGSAPIEDRRVLACLPTMTTISRQAIFAGALPMTFVDTIDRTNAEPTRWREFWQQEGLSTGDIHYFRTEGSDAASWADPPEGSVVTGVAVNAIDDLMHGVSVNGDHQFHAGVTTWLGGGFLERALEWAHRTSTQVWVTADHGNLPCFGLGEPVRDEGIRVLGRGLRSRVYASEQHRSSADLPGTAWTPPGFPAEAGAPLFAPDRRYFRRTGGVITHGGLSLDEVVVPLARIA